eukprot:TRINITY_DN87744_c0_g1_i1.p1 TRINITY_DN87744_c0_g1~~TRINITY_DN87744_c0_g1_i1.p1  ORF type:complete len:140 (+),score=25.30 TRINITY_DN87744_c0_g1_i1:54-473(+)
MGAGHGTASQLPPVPPEEAAAASKVLLGAARRCNADVVQRALTSRADPNTRSEHSGRPVLSFAAQCMDSTEPLQHILAARASVDAKANDGRTALHVAVAWERGAAVSKLIEAGASTNVADAHGLTPTELARRRNRVTIS